MSYDREPNYDQCTVCKNYEFMCDPPSDGSECDGREIDPKRWKYITGEEYKPVDC